MQHLILTKSQLLSYAWVLARSASRQHRLPVRQCLSGAFRLAWAAWRVDTAKAARMAALAASLPTPAEAEAMIAARAPAPRSHVRPLGRHLTGVI